MAASREMIGKYGRNENLPSIEMVAKMARAFGVTVEFFSGKVKTLLTTKKRWIV
ncbi:hypothetical protein [Cyclobacterium xiamenense]|uniref:hypothetical protein n=1 Tax=Cyclobacterium xiamenense TaxID=1297121 RepID=UPI003742ACC4